MKYLSTIILLAVGIFNVFSQTNETIKQDSTNYSESIIDYFETPPEFPGGMDSLWCFIETNLNFNIINSQKDFGKVYSVFVIKSTGQVSSIKINPEYTRRAPGFLKDSIIENEIKRVLQLMPRWTPATQRNIPIRISFSLLFQIPYTDFKCKQLSNPTARYWKVDKPARFVYKGVKDTRKSIAMFVSEHMVWPSQDDCVGNILVRVFVDETGKLSDYTIIRGLDGCRGFNEESLRLIKLMPHWIPAEVKGKPVKSYYIIPINFMF